jgi:hypothetical protein
MCCWEIRQLEEPARYATSILYSVLCLLLLKSIPVYLNTMQLLREEPSWTNHKHWLLILLTVQIHGCKNRSIQHWGHWFVTRNVHFTRRRKEKQRSWHISSCSSNCPGELSIYTKIWLVLIDPFIDDHSSTALPDCRLQKCMWMELKG